VPEDPRLTIELVPKSCWYTNVRSNVTRAEWEICKRLVRDRSNDRCEVCGGRGTRWPVECHEIWDYDDEECVQRLAGLTALCPRCHEVKHIGRAEAMGHLNRALAHLATVNGWVPAVAAMYAADAFAVWRTRSKFAWTLDISYLSEVLDPEVSHG